MARGIDYLGPYRLVKLVRVGQTCQIWEALKDAKEGRICLKMLQPSKANDKGEIAYLKHEYEVATELIHPRIIKVHEYNDSQGIPYIVMELFNALNLKQGVREQSGLVAHLAGEIVEQAAESLGFMHEKNWIHCDVKPDNFLVNQTGDLRLIDFAISERPKKGLAGLFGKRSTVRGTRSYMSPEQILGKPLDARSDVYSFGCVLYEVLAGRPPFTGSTPNELLTKHLRASVPSLAAANNKVTPEFTDLVYRTMSKKKDRRPESMLAFLKEFSGMRVYRTGMKPPPPNQDGETGENTPA